MGAHTETWGSPWVHSVMWGSRLCLAGRWHTVSSRREQTALCQESSDGCNGGGGLKKGGAGSMLGEGGGGDIVVFLKMMQGGGMQLGWGRGQLHAA